MAFSDKILKNKNLKEFVVQNIEEKTKEFFHAGSITLNLLLSGKVNGGIPKGKITMLAAPRAHFKSIIATISAGNAQKRGEFVVWIDSEFAFDPTTARMFGLSTDNDKFLLVQDNSLENVRSIIMNLFVDFNKAEDKVFMVIDSLGTMITSKTVQDALDGEDKRDMTTAQKKNDLSKLILGISGKNNVSVVMVNHLYEDMKMHSTGTIGGGNGAQYVASQILKITSKRKEKDGNDVKGNIFTAYADKGRYSKENSKLTFLASYDDGINTWYGLLDDALEGGYIEKPSNGFYTRPSVPDDKKWRESQIYNNDFWIPLLKNTDIIKYLESKYSYDNTLSDEVKVYDNTLKIED